MLNMTLDIFPLGLFHRTVPEQKDKNLHKSLKDWGLTDELSAWTRYSFFLVFLPMAMRKRMSPSQCGNRHCLCYLCAAIIFFMTAQWPRKQISIPLLMPKMPKVFGCDKSGINLCCYLTVDICLLYGRRAPVAQSGLCSPAGPGRCSEGLQGPICVLWEFLCRISPMKLWEHLPSFPCFLRPMPGISRVHLYMGKGRVSLLTKM